MSHDSTQTTLSFQSTLLMRGATCGLAARQSVAEFQSTLLMRGATLYHSSVH